MGWKKEKDGITINQFFEKWWPEWKRFLTPWKDIKGFVMMHSWINIWTEPRSWGPGHGYHFGHVVGILIMVLVLLVVFT